MLGGLELSEELSMNIFNFIIVVFYVFGLLIIVASIISFLAFKGRRYKYQQGAISAVNIDRLENVETPEQVRELLMRHQVLKSIQTDLKSHVVAAYASDNLSCFEQLCANKGISAASELAMDINVGILEVTRKQETRLAKEQADELLNVLRDELAIPRTDISADEKLQLVRTRIIKLTEMLAEVQVSLTGVEHRVLDIESMVQQLPSVINNHRDNILSLYQSVSEIRETMATKSELRSVEKQLDLLKWSFSGALGAVFTVLGWILVKLLN
jgi:hypothetical protein